MQTVRQAADNAAATTASDDHVRRLQSQLQSTAEQLVALGRTDIVLAVVEQAVAASGSQAVEPGQPGQPQEQPPAKRLKAAAAAATTAQLCVPRYVVPPATGDLAYGSSHWDRKPAEIHAMILKLAGPLTRFLCGLLGDAATLDVTTRLQLWTDAFKTDWQGDLALLPDVRLTADNGLLLAHSRSMYDRLCRRFPQQAERLYTRNDANYNNYYDSFIYNPCDSDRLLLIPMRHGWFDLLDFLYPIALARMSINWGCIDLLKHLDDKYKILQHWMARQDPTSEYWRRAVNFAASQGHLDVVQYLFDAGVTGCTDWAMDNAALNGHLHVIKWLHENRTEGCTTMAMDWAAMHGHFDVVKWLHANRTEGCTMRAMRDAARYGNFDIVQWLHETRGEPCTPEAVNAAIYSGRIDIVKYMHSKGGRASNEAIDLMPGTGNAEMLQYLMDYGYDFEPIALNRAKTAAIANILLGSLTLDRAQTLLARAKQGEGTKATVKRLESTIKKLQKPHK